MPGPAERLRSASGFTLLELVVVVAITTIVAGLVTSFVARPMEGYRDLRLRGQLVERADSAVRRLARDVHAALPNSVRVSADARSLELLHTVDGGRYRDGPGINPSTENHNATSDRLQFNAGDASFNVLGRLRHLGFSYGTPLAAGHRVAVYPTGTQVYSDAATGANPGLITPAATTLTLTDDTDEDQIGLSAAHRFSLASPQQRFYLVDTPVSYLCNLGAGRFTRYAGYSIASAQPTDPSVSPLSSASSALMSDRISACSFAYDPGTPSRAGLLSVALTLTQGGESVRVFQQIHLDNTP